MSRSVRAAGLALLLVVMGVAAPATADARSVRVPLIPGRGYWGVTFNPRATVFFNLYAVGPSGSNVSFACTGARRLCPSRPLSITLGSSGIHRFPHVIRTRPGAVVLVTTVDPSGARRVTSLTVRRSRAPAQSGRCFLPGQDTEVDCFVTCDTEVKVRPGDRCADAGRYVARPRQDGKAEWRGSRSRFKRLILTRVPRDVFVVVKCESAGRSCPFFLSVRLVRSGRLDVGRMLRRRWLAAGTVVELTLFRGGTGGQVVRYTMRRQRVPRVRNLCLDPGKSVPHRCR